MCLAKVQCTAMKIGSEDGAGGGAIMMIVRASVCPPSSGFFVSLYGQEIAFAT